MSALGDAVLQYPISGSYFSAGGVAVKVVSVATSASFSQVYSTTSSLGLLPPNGNRTGLSIHNSGSNALLVGFGFAPSKTKFSWKIGPDSRADMPDPILYLGILSGTWDSGADSGSLAMITEFTQ